MAIDLLISPNLESCIARDKRRASWTGTWKQTLVSTSLTAAVVLTLIALEFLAAKFHTTYHVDELLFFVLIGIATQSLGILGHETYHDSFFRSPQANARAGAWLFHYPLLGRFGLLKEVHLRHHRFFGTDQDPDIDHWGWRQGDRRHLAHIFSILLGIQFIRSVASLVPGGKSTQNVSESAGSRLDIVGVVMTQAVILGVFASLGCWPRYFLMWILPTVTVGALVEHLRVFAEHNGGTLRIYARPNRIAELMFGRANFRLHALHHQAPSVPWFAIGSKFDRVSSRTGTSLEIAPGYWSQLRKVFK